MLVGFRLLQSFYKHVLICGMAKKNQHKNRQGVVYSTNEDYVYDNPFQTLSNTPKSKQQHLKVMIDKKRRRGKQVTLVIGFTGMRKDLEALGKLLKSKCGVGGTAKDGEILIQGNFKDKVYDILIAEGYAVKKVG